MVPNRGRRVRKIEVPTDNVPEFELGDTVADIQRRREKSEDREMEEAQQQTEKAAREEGHPEKDTGENTVTLRLLEESWVHHSHATRSAT